VLFNFSFKGKVAEDLIQSGIEDHAFGSKNVREHFRLSRDSIGKSLILKCDERKCLCWSCHWL